MYAAQSWTVIYRFSEELGGVWKLVDACIPIGINMMWMRKMLRNPNNFSFTRKLYYL